MRLAAAIVATWTAASAVAALVVGRVIAAGNRLAAPPTVPLPIDVFDGDDRPLEAQHDDCKEVVWQFRGNNGTILSLIATEDGRLALFAADMQNFVAARMQRSDVQRARLALTEWLVGTARTVSL